MPREVFNITGNPANVNAGKNMFDCYYCIKVSKKSILDLYFNVLFWHYFVLIILHRRPKIISIYILVLGPSVLKQLLNHGGKLARVVAEFTKCSGCLPSILIKDNCIFFTFWRQVRLVALRFARCPFRFSFWRQTQEIPMARKWITKAVINSSGVCEFPD